MVKSVMSPALEASCGSRISSVTLKVDSNPQKQKTESRSPWASCSNEGMENGLSQSRLKGCEPANRPYPQKPSRTAYSKTRRYFWKVAADRRPVTAVKVTATRTTMPSAVDWAVESGSSRSPATSCSPPSPASWSSAEPVTVVV